MTFDVTCQQIWPTLKMETWFLKCLIVFSVIPTEYLMSDTKTAPFPLSKNGGFKIERFRRHAGFLRRKRLVENDNAKVLGEELRKHSENIGSESNPCLTVPCANDGVCTWRYKKQPSFTCKCALGYTGKWCDKALPECDTQPCTEKGSCIATPKGFICVCKEGFDGIYCEDKRKKNETGLVLTPEVIHEGEIVLGIFGGLVLFIVVILIIHFVRVCNRREEMKTQYHILLASEDSPPPLPPGLFVVSNLLCREFFCCLCPKRSLTLYEKKFSRSELKEACDEVMENFDESKEKEGEPLINEFHSPKQLLSRGSVRREDWRNDGSRSEPLLRSVNPPPSVQCYSEPVISYTLNKNTLYPQPSMHTPFYPEHSRNTLHLAHSKNTLNPEHSRNMLQPEHSRNTLHLAHSKNTLNPEHSRNMLQPEHSRNTLLTDHLRSSSQIKTRLSKKTIPGETRAMVPGGTLVSQNLHRPQSDVMPRDSMDKGVSPVQHNLNLPYTETMSKRDSLKGSGRLFVQSYTQTVPSQYGSIQEKQFDTKQYRHSQSLVRAFADNKRSFQRDSPSVVTPIEEREQLRQKDLKNKKILYNSDDEENDAMFNVNHKISPKIRRLSRVLQLEPENIKQSPHNAFHNSHSSQLKPVQSSKETLRNKRSSRVLPSKRSFTEKTDLKKWSYNVDPHELANRRKSIRDSNTSQDGNVSSQDSRHSSVKLFSRLKHSRSKNYDDSAESEHNRRSAKKMSRGNLSIPPAPPLPPLPKGLYRP